MLNCKSASQLVSQSLDRKLGFNERWKLKFHLFMCDACSQFNQQLYQLRITLKKITQRTEEDVSIKLSDTAKNRIKEKINS